jgi:GNAT superfamily N-acetyltransferase
MANVRMVSTEDVRALARVLKSVDWLPAAKQPLERMEKAMRRFLETVEATPASTVLVAEQEGKVVGFIAFHLHPSVLAAYEGCVSHLFVHADARGQGIGRRLLAAAEQKAAARGCGRLLLYISRSRPAYQRRFYEQAGWQEREDAALFVRDLSAKSEEDT